MEHTICTSWPTCHSCFHSLYVLQQVQCYVCKRTGHLCCIALEDASSTPVSCYQCGDLGHTGLSCNSQNGERGDQSSCYKCGQEGHLARECPQTNGDYNIVGSFLECTFLKIGSNNFKAFNNFNLYGVDNKLRIPKSDFDCCECYVGRLIIMGKGDRSLTLNGSKDSSKGVVRLMRRGKTRSQTMKLRMWTTSQTASSAWCV